MTPTCQICRRIFSDRTSIGSIAWRQNGHTFYRQNLAMKSMPICAKTLPTWSLSAVRLYARVLKTFLFLWWTVSVEIRSIAVAGGRRGWWVLDLDFGGSGGIWSGRRAGTGGKLQEHCVSTFSFLVSVRHAHSGRHPPTEQLPRGRRLSARERLDLSRQFRNATWNKV